MTLALICALANAASAAPGFVEINKAKAAVGGLGGDFVADPPGYPITITRPGHYILTSELEVVDPNLGAIEVRTSDVTIDLNGFAIRGGASCSGLGAGITCSPGSGRGIRSDFVDSDGQAVSGVVVRNGVVRGFAAGGVLLAEDSRVEDMLAIANGGAGIALGAGSVARGSTASRNGAGGILGGSLLERCVSRGNRLMGFQVDFAAVRDSVSIANGGAGISIPVGTASVLGSVSVDNAGAGLDFPLDFGQGGYGASVLSLNLGGSVSGLAVNQGANACNGAVCP